MGNKADRRDDEKYRSLFNRIADPVVIFDQTTHRILDWNLSFLRVYGYTPAELKTMTPFDLHPPQEVEKVENTINVLNVNYSYQYTHLTKDGRRIFVEILSDEMQYQGQPAWISIIRDITQRKNAEEELRKLSRAVEQSPVSVLITDTKGRIEYINPKFTRLTGYTAEEAIGQNPRILKSDKNPSELYQDLWQTISSGKEWRGELCNKKKNGDLFWESASICPIRDAEGNVTHYLGVKEDITERKKAEEALRRAKEAAEQATQAKSQFLANMSHEIRTPLNAIIGMSELAQEMSSTDELTNYLNVIQRSSESLLTLVEDILDFSKIESGQMEVEFTEFDLHELVENVAEMFALRANDKGIELLCYVDPDVPRHVRGDSTKIRQVLVNLVGNAIKFTEKGEVSLKALRQNESVARQKTEPCVPLKFVVSDTGIGISQKNIQKIFQSFSQEDSSIKRKFGGTGLGLSISKSLVELMGGELDLVSKRGEGSVFTVRLCLTPVRKAQNPMNDELPGCTDRSVLIVDDNSTNRFILKKMLSNLGVRVSEAANGRDALSFLKQSKPVDLFLVDQHMPEIDGLTLIQKIREQPQYRKTEVIILSPTASCDLDAKEELTISDFINKPIKQSRLKDILLNTFKPDNEGAESSLGGKKSQVNQKKVLLVEDNLDNQRLAKTILEKSGYRVEIADNGKKAVERVKDTPFDVILMDIYMPVMDGLEATRRIREWEHRNEQTPSIIIAVTAHAIEGYREKCLASGMNDFITKPIRKKNLIQKISALLNETNSAIQAPSHPTLKERSST